MKNYLKVLGYVGIGILGLTLILTILSYFDLLGDTVVNIIKLLITIISVAVGGYMIGQSSIKKGWLSGLKLAGIIIVLLFLLTLIFRLGLSLRSILYYAIILASSTAGSMIGISLKNEKKQ
ncbi:MAG: TIGR04086 family membrane protein [Bacilli bacterium]|nr:TIGR04086 family membrane protein [Bacilli bacterium]MDD4298530.1 TIGR04086 family membrane protein [Bacilli bacterium]MDD4643530.1 TIGR04086 family membrane protein [Bacilli bacterium]